MRYDEVGVSHAIAEVGSTANQYEILAKLAEGGMAEIFLARAASAGGVARYVVLKRILPRYAMDAQFLRMFLDEARLAAQLQHQNIAQVYDVGKLGDSYFFTMEYVHGETLRAIVARTRASDRIIPLDVILTIAAGAAGGLHHAHERIGLGGQPLGIVHRDVSPSNLMVSYEGAVKLVDFGVAKASDRLHETRSGAIKGKISYLSPEQCHAGEIDRRSDLFSLGIVMWELLARERLYRRASDFENMSAIIHEPTPAPSTRRPNVPPELDALVLKLVEKSPDARFQTAAELLEAIEGLAVRVGASLSTSGLAKFLRDVFGPRPEPWLETEADAEPLTVNSEPIPIDLVAKVASSIDLQLATVRTRFGGEARAGDLGAKPEAPPRKSRWLVVLAFVFGAATAAAIAMFAIDRPDGGGSRAAARDAAAAPLVIANARDADVPADADRAVVAMTRDAEVATVPDAAPSVVIPPRLDVAREFAGGHFWNVVHACAAATAIPPDQAPSCVLSACRVHERVRARQWLADVAASRRSDVAVRCRAVDAAAASAAGSAHDAGGADCSDPLACMR